ncbi:protein FAR1-RELATED SEQUENCE 5-like [Chenopodium quinoa]|uniref:protein FAR1-RELATED SEQUENCE 5-like n=1 Tax=Chenopodium quinoa TaxID=63459 RepID=UPI000B779473|nr:protein FAR1-RELATED SEQUENCE 5-like [Chenopodium quinoa]
MVHNHEMIPVDKRHLIRSQRDFSKEQIKFISTLRLNGVKVSDFVRALKKEVGGSPNFCFTAPNSNFLQRDKLMKHISITTLNKMKLVHWLGFFWRDGRMMRDYHYFGDLLVFDTMYRTNKYGMICAPFVGMSHHANNVMFSMGFVLNERTKAFEWLFDTFITSMGRKCPITIMTDQGQAIAISGMVMKYDYEKVDWMCDFYKIKEMWCPSYSKQYWFGGVLSSQRIETTNKSVSQGLNKTQGLCDFYQVFLDVVHEWISKESGKDYNTIRGNRHLAFAYIGILVHARLLYTIQAYVVFEEEFIKGIACDHKDFGLNYPEYSIICGDLGKI